MGVGERAVALDNETLGLVSSINETTSSINVDSSLCGREIQAKLNREHVNDRESCLGLESNNDSLIDDRFNPGHINTTMASFSCADDLEPLIFCENHSAIESNNMNGNMSHISDIEMTSIEDPVTHSSLILESSIEVQRVPPVIEHEPLNSQFKIIPKKAASIAILVLKCKFYTTNLRLISTRIV